MKFLATPLEAACRHVTTSVEESPVPAPCWTGSADGFWARQPSARMMNSLASTGHCDAHRRRRLGRPATPSPRGTGGERADWIGIRHACVQDLRDGYCEQAPIKYGMPGRSSF